MAARKSPRAGATEVAHPASALLASTLQGMGEVLGPGAIYSLVHYVSVQQGRQVAAGDGTGEGLARRIGQLVGLDVRIEDPRAKVVHVTVVPAQHFPLEDRAGMALVVGLLEGALTPLHRHKMQLKGEPRRGADGSLDLEFSG